MRNKVNRALVAKKMNLFSQKNHSEENLTLFRYATMVVVLLFAFGYSDAWASSDYARGFAKVSSSSPSGAGKVYVAYTSSGGSQPATPAASSSSWKTSEASAQAEGTKTTFDFYYYSLPTSGYALEGWSETDGASDYSNEAVAKYSIKTSSCTANDAYTDVRLYAHFVPNPTVTVTFLAPDPKCTYAVTCDGANVAVGSSKTTNKSFNLAVTVNDANYKLLGWYTTTDGGVTKSYFSPNSTYTNKYFPQTCSVGVDLVEANKPVFMVRDKLFTDLNAANTAAGGSGTIVLVSDGLLDVGNYTISSGNTLLIPHTIGSTFVNAKSVIDAPYIVKTAAPLSAFRKLTLQDGVNITVNGKICVAGKMMSSGGGKASAYPTGELGIIDMSRGGHIELNSGAIMYVWGFIKGQDMDQGNNTTGAGTITANAGSVVWEGFATGDWRGGSASSTLYDNASSWKFFPFQSYTVQNIEVPVTYNYNSTLSNYMSIFGDGQVYNGTFDLIGSSNTLFLLKNSSSKLKKWYDPTTDLVCYEMSGSTQLDALNVDAAGETVSSKDYNLPISTSMHIIMASSTTISKPIEVQAGAVIEIKNGATVTCSSNVYLFDKDQWGEYCNSKYYYTMTNLSIHKDRGDGKSNAMIDDAKLIIDGTLNVTGKLYTTSGGADIMGNGGGKISFGNLGSSTNIVMCTGVSTNENVAINQGCLHNEDESYTKAIASTTFHNVNGRWFKASSKDEKANHTYDFTYISSGAVSGTGGTNTTTDAVYSWDKTGLELRQKWFNVTADGCANWWHGQGEQTTWFYNWTLNSDWHQFIPTATTDLYSGSNNTLYTKTSCTWEELGSTDVNCLYEIGGVKKALVEGEFIALEPNNNDPAYHAANDASQYYICFSGCNWHAADKYTEAEKAYTVESETFIWYNNAWMSVNFQEQFAYTIDETNVPVYYEYVDGEWVLAAPYVRVVDGIEDRSFWFLADAFTFANSALRTSPTITILREISGITTAVSYTGANKTCTLDLNGHTITGSVTKMLNINAAGCTFIITDNTELKQGKISMSGSENARLYAVAVTDGTLILGNGTIFGENTQEYVKDVTTSTAVSAVYVAAGKTFTMNNGMVHAKGCYAARGVDVAGSASANATVNINKGTVTAETTQVTYAYGIYAVGGTINVKNNATINATSKTTTAYGIYIDASTKKYYGTLNMTGGTVNVTNLTSGPAGGVFVQGVHIMSNVSNTTPNTIASSYLGVANISGGTFTVKNSSKTTGYGIYSLGNTTVSGSPVFNVTTTTTTAYGLFVQDGTTTINGTPTFNVKGTEIAYGVYANGATPANKSGRPYNPQVTVNGGTFNVQTTSKTTAYGIYVDGNTRPLTSTASGYYQGNYASAGNVIVNGGIFNVTAKTTKSYGVVVAAPKEEAGATEYDPVTANPKATINGGYFRMAGTGDVNAVNDLSTTDNLKVNGGYYSHDGNLATYTPSPKHVLTLTAGDANRPPYYYKVAEAYLVTFKSEDGTANIIDPVYQENGTKPVCSMEPTKASTTTNSFTFDGWATSAGGAKVYNPDGLPNVSGAATYYAHFATTTLKYRVHFDVATNDGVCATENIYVEPSATVGTLPTATKYGHTFNGWFTAATGGTQLTEATVINADAEYFAQFTVNKYTLTWILDGGKVTTAGTAAAKNATGSPSGEVAYNAVITVPVVAKTGFVFANWTPAPATKMPAEAATYTAHWNPATNTAYSVKHYLQNVDGTYPADPFVTDALTGTTGASVTPAVNSYEGFVSPSAQTVTIAADGSTVVTYQYARRHYTFTLDAATNGGTSDLPSIEVIHGATIGTVPPDAQKGCNDFVGWYTKAVGGVKITSAFVIEYDMKTLYAQFSDDIRIYPITYLPGENGTGAVAAETKTCGVNTTLSSSTFTRTGYTQTGWSTTDGGAKVYDFGDSYTANAALTLYPFWTVNQYTISFNSNGGSEVASITQNYNTAVTAPANPTKTGYTFTGWDPAVPGTMPAENTECVAQWTINQYTISFDSNGGSDVASITQDYNTAVTAPANPTKTGYTFAGWVPAVPNPMPAENTECVAQWTINSHNLAWNWGGGETSSTTHTAAGSVTFGTTISYPDAATMTKENYAFSGWSTDATTMPDEDLTITAQWVPAVASVAAEGEATTYHATVADAILTANGKTGATVTMLQNASVESEVTITASMTINLNGKTISSAVASATGVFKINAHTYTVTINGAGGTISHKANASVYGLNVVAGTLNMTGGTVEADGGSGNPRGVFVKGASSSKKATVNLTDVSVESKSTGNNSIAVYTYQYTNVTIHSGTYKATANSSSARYAVFARNATGSQITIRGGKFNGADKDVNKGGTTATITISGGYYVHDSNLEDYCATNYHVFDLAGESPYLYEVAEGYTLAWTTDGDALTGDYTDGLTKVGATIVAPNTPTKTGYTFAGWDPAVPSTMPAENTEHTATWTANNYTITYKDQGDAAFSGVHGDGYPTTHTYGTATALVNPTKTGYAFGGWYTVPDCTSGLVTSLEATAYTAAITLYAKWTPITYSVRFNKNDEGAAGTMSNQDFTYDVAQALTSNAFTKTGYNFAGWATTADGDVAYANSESVSNLSSTQDAVVDLYAKWTAATYEVILDPRSGTGGSASVTMTYNSSEHTAITNPTRTGYSFHSWNTTTSSSTRKIVISSKGVLSENVAGYTGAGGVWIRTTATTLYARWSELTYTTYFSHNGNGTISFNGSVVASGGTAKVYYHTAKSLVATPNTGYHFTGWTVTGTNASKVTIADMSAASTTIKATAKNATVTAGFAPDEYTITYKDQGDVAFSGVHGDGYPTTHTYGTATALVNPTKAGYAFEGWYDNADCTGAALTEIGTTAYTADFTLYAKWTINQYTISFNSDGGSDVASITQDYNSSVSAPADPTKTGYTFAGWSPEVPSVMPAEDTECVAQWTPNTNTPYVIKHYQQNLDGTYPSEPNDTDNETGTTDTEVTPAVKSYTGFTAPSAQTVTILADGSREVTYNYTRNSYNLTWDANGGELSGSYTSGLVKFGATITAPTANRTNYDFEGWNETPVVTMPAEDKTYTAQWSLSAVTILWKSEDGAETLETDDLVLIGATPSFDGTTPTKATTEAYTYTFDGWTTEVNGAGTFYAVGNLPTVSGAATYYAHFTATANVVSVTVSGATTYYTTLQDAFNYAANKTTPKITVLKDIALGAKVTYTSAKATTVTFELNGHKVSGAANQLFYITGSSGKACTFVIQDSSTGEKGQIYNIISSNGARSCVYVYYGTVELHSGKIYMENTSSSSNVTAYGVQVRSGSGYVFNMKGGTIEAKSTKHAHSIYSMGTTTITAGTLKATETKNGYASGVHVASGTTTISGSPIFDISGTKYVNGVRVGGYTPAINSKKTAVTMYNGVANIEGGTFTVTASSNTAYGVYCYGSTYKLDYATSSTLAGNYANGGTANVSGGEFTVTSKGATAYGVCLQEPTSIQTALDADGNATYAAATTNPKATITGGKFKVSGTSSVGAVNTSASNTALKIQGGWYNINTNLSGYVAPTKDCNYYCLATTAEDKATVGNDYNWKVAEAYMLTWILDGGKVTVAGSGAAFDETGTPSAPWAVGDAITAPTVTKTDYTFNGWTPDVAATMPASDKTYTATWTLAETGYYLDIVDWTASALTINANGWAASGWPYTINGTAYEKEDRAADRTLTIPYSGAAGTDLQIKVESGGSTTSLHNYKIPFINTTEGAGEEDVVYVNSGTLTIDGSTTLAALYVRPEASVEVTSGTLTVSKLVLRTLPWQAAAISGNFTATETYYTRIAPNKRTISGPDGEITYESARYYQFALPLNCTAQMKDIQVSNAANTPYGNTWLLKRYNEETRAENGAGADNWVALGNEDYIQGGVGYEMFSNSNYYREFYFPLGAVSSASLGTTTAVSYHLGAAGEKHAGWNIICSPLMSTYTNSIKSLEDLETALKISELMTDGSYWQHVPEEIPAAIPFSYQASNTGDYLYFNEISLVQKIVRRAHTAAEPEHIQWLNLFVKDDNGRGDETSILTHPTRYEDTYKTGIDVAKQSFTASRALIYSSHAYGEMAFAGVSDELLEKGVPLTLFSPAEKELTFSMRENDWLDRMANVWLIDKETGARTDLLVSDYTFTATEGTIEGRFVIEGQFHAPQVTTGLDEGQSDNGVKVRKIMVEDKIFIQINDRTYDATGKLVNGK